jgi:hypothetical protein
MEIEEDVNYVYVHLKDYIKNIILLEIKYVVKVEKAPMKSSGCVTILQLVLGSYSPDIVWTLSGHCLDIVWTLSGHCP